MTPWLPVPWMCLRQRPQGLFTGNRTPHHTIPTQVPAEAPDPATAPAPAPPIDRDAEPDTEPQPEPPALPRIRLCVTYFFNLLDVPPNARREIKVLAASRGSAERVTKRQTGTTVKDINKKLGAAIIAFILHMADEGDADYLPGPQHGGRPSQRQGVQVFYHRNYIRLPFRTKVEVWKTFCTFWLLQQTGREVPYAEWKKNPPCSYGHFVHVWRADKRLDEMVKVQRKKGEYKG